MAEQLDVGGVATTYILVVTQLNKGKYNTFIKLSIILLILYLEQIK